MTQRSAGKHCSSAHTSHSLETNPYQKLSKGLGFWSVSMNKKKVILKVYIYIDRLAG